MGASAIAIVPLCEWRIPTFTVSPLSEAVVPEAEVPSVVPEFGAAQEVSPAVIAQAAINAAIDLNFFIFIVHTFFRFWFTEKIKRLISFLKELSNAVVFDIIKTEEMKCSRLCERSFRSVFEYYHITPLQDCQE